MLGARVAGHISSILAGDNTTVRAGDVVFRIDDGDYKIAVDAAATRIATQQATIDRIGRQIAALDSQVAQAKAQLVSAEAGLKRADLDYERQQALSSKGFASRATFESSEAGRDQGAAAVKAAQAAYNVAISNVDVAKAQQAEAQAQLAELKTTFAKAERDLNFTSVRAPVDGTFSNRLVNTGDFVAVGQRLGNIVPLDDVYIDANFKETQLKRIRPGQPVTIRVDAYGFRKFSGVVDSISPAAGSVFTLLPPDNATGNFTKIVQRLPVRIRVPKSVAQQNLLRAGMSVYATVDYQQGRGRRRQRGRSRRSHDDPSAVASSAARSDMAYRHDRYPRHDGEPRFGAHCAEAAVRLYHHGVRMFMSILDIQIVSASLVEIQAGLSASQSEGLLGQTAYLIAEVIAIPLSGFLSRALGTRLLFAISAAGLHSSSLLCGFAPRSRR
jgi:membrane fusion protein (multidrug efflux system)